MLAATWCIVYDCFSEVLVAKLHYSEPIVLNVRLAVIAVDVTVDTYADLMVSTAKLSRKNRE